MRIAHELIERVEFQTHARETIVVQTLRNEFTPCHILTPTGVSPPYKAILAIHGHGTFGTWPVIGEPQSDEARKALRLMNYDYALQLVRRGYIVFVPFQRGLCERMESAQWQEPRGSDSPNPSLCPGP